MATAIHSVEGIIAFLRVKHPHFSAPLPCWDVILTYKFQDYGRSSPCVKCLSTRRFQVRLVTHFAIFKISYNLYSLTLHIYVIHAYYKYHSLVTMICFPSENLATLKPTSQSSQAGNSFYGVNGLYDFDRPCTHTDIGGEMSPWWTVDLQQVEPVSEVYLVSNKKNVHAERLWNIEVRVGRLPIFSTSFNAAATFSYNIDVHLSPNVHYVS